MLSTTMLPVGIRRENECIHTENVATKRNKAYEITVLARQKVNMEQNPAYEQVNMII